MKTTPKYRMDLFSPPKLQLSKFRRPSLFLPDGTQIQTQVLSVTTNVASDGNFKYYIFLQLPEAYPRDSSLCHHSRSWILQIISSLNSEWLNDLITCPIAFLQLSLNERNLTELYIDYFIQTSSALRLGDASEVAISKGIAKKFLTATVKELKNYFPSIARVRLHKESLRVVEIPPFISKTDLLEAVQFLKNYCPRTIDWRKATRTVEAVRDDTIALHDNEEFKTLFIKYSEAVDNIHLEQYYRSNFALLPEGDDSVCHWRYLSADIDDFLQMAEKPEVDVVHIAKIMDFRRSERLYEKSARSRAARSSRRASSSKVYMKTPRKSRRKRARKSRGRALKSRRKS
jgi:hypothetical protein